MRLLALLALTLAGCAMSGPLDVITPDELTFGSGHAETSVDGLERGAASESTYAALTWDLPSWEGREGGMDRETQRDLSLLIDRMATEMAEGYQEGVELRESGGTLPLINGAEPPPAWLPFTLIGAGLVIVLGFVLYSRRRDQW